MAGPDSQEKEELPGVRFLREAGLAHGDDYFRTAFDVLPAAVYLTDAYGLITYYNEAAARLWGRRPPLGESQWCGSWKLYWPDGRPMPHGECPMALALQKRRPVRGVDAIAGRPDGTQVHFSAYSAPYYDASGALSGAVNVLVDISDRLRTDEQAQRLASIVNSSEDAIISKSLDGVIASWNRGAERLFGYSAEEVIGKPITILIPVDRHDEEPVILGRIRRGEQIEHYETVRQRKDGTLVDISLSVSPVKNSEGNIIGASKIARDISERRRAEERQQLLLLEMHHRIKNLFSVAASIVVLSARSANTATELAASVNQRLSALARAHSLTMPGTTESAGPPAMPEQSTTLHALIRTIASPYESALEGAPSRVTVKGPDIAVGSGSITSLALLLNEFATNAAKYGALSIPTGYLDIACSEDGDQFRLTWRERGGPPVERRGRAGFGTKIALATVKGQLGGELLPQWDAEGLTIFLSVPRERLLG
jgi:PAS domain S-box-containing protein